MQKNLLKKINVLILIMLVCLTCINIVHVDLKAEETDTYPPEIISVENNPDSVGFGFNVSINPSITDNMSGVNLVKVNITFPDNSTGNFTMNNTGNSTYDYIFSDTWIIGQYNYTIWTIDNANNTNISSQCSFNVSANAIISAATLKNTYGEDEFINLTDPPNPCEDYYLVNRGLTWNEYCNAMSGSNVLETYTEPVNYQEYNGTWTPINNSLKQLATNHPAYSYDYRVGNEQGLYNVYFKPNIQNNWPVTFAYNKSKDPTTYVVRSKLVGVGYLDPQSNWAYEYLQNVQNSQGQFTSNKAIYENVFTGIDVTWSYYNTVLKEKITLSNTTKTLLQNHPPSLYGLQNNSSYLVFITKLDYQNLILYNASGTLNSNVTISDGWIAFKDNVLGNFKCALPIGDAYELFNESVRHKLVYRIIQYNGNYYLLSGLKIQDLNNMMFPVVIDPTLSVTSSESDVYLYVSSSDYNDAWSAGDGTISSDESYISVGQSKVATFPPDYRIRRGFFIFNTSELPTNSYIDNATLSLYKKDDYSNTDFTITVQNGQPENPHDPLIEGDYNKEYYSGNGGELNTVNFVNGSNNITLTELSWINIDGVTKLCLRSNYDIDGKAPTGSEYVNVYSADYDPEANPDPRPKLIINYRNQSKIMNTGSNDISGYLFTQVQCYSEPLDEWVVADYTINETTLRTIKAGEQLALDTVFNGIVNSSNLSYGNGNYRVYVAFRDCYGNVLKCDDDYYLETSCGFLVYRPMHGWYKLFVGDGFGNKSNLGTRAITIYKDELYIGTENHNWSKLLDLILSCIGFPGGTRITMSNGNYKNIEDIESGDIVKAYDIGNGSYVDANVTMVYHHTSEWTPDYYFKFNDQLSVSPKHLLYVNGTLMKAEDAKVGDYLTDVNGSNVTISSKVNMSERLSMFYYFEIALNGSEEPLLPSNLTYFAEDIRVYPWGRRNVTDYSFDFGLSDFLDLIDLIGILFLDMVAWVVSETSDGCEVWKYNYTTNEWTELVGNTTGCSDLYSGFGDSRTAGVGDMIEFNGKLYVGTYHDSGCEIWRYDGSSWEQVVGDEDSAFIGRGFNNSYNYIADTMEVFTNSSNVTHLYVGTINFDWSYDGFCQVWRTADGENWSKVVDRGFRDNGAESDVRNAYLWSMEVFQDELYAGTFNIPIPDFWGHRGCQLWRTSSGNVGDWEKVPIPGYNPPGYNDDNGFGEDLNYGIRKLVKWGDDLYVGVAASPLQALDFSHEACEIWKYDGSDWTCIVGDDSGKVGYWDDGFGDYYNKYPWSMEIVDNVLWAGTVNHHIIKSSPFLDSKGCEVWCYNGTDLIASVEDDNGEKPNGFGEWFNRGARSMIEYPVGSGNVVVGTFTYKSIFEDMEGCEIWMRRP